MFSIILDFKSEEELLGSEILGGISYKGRELGQGGRSLMKGNYGCRRQVKTLRVEWSLNL